MSIRAIAVDLYRAKQKFERCEREFSESSPENKAKAQQELANAKREHDMLEKMLNGKKESGTYEQKFTKNRFSI